MVKEHVRLERWSLCEQHDEPCSFHMWTFSPFRPGKISQTDMSEDTNDVRLLSEFDRHSCDVCYPRLEASVPSEAAAGKSGEGGD